MGIMSAFSERISDMLFEFELTPENFAEKIGVNSSVVYRWIQKKQIATLSNALKVSQFFNCSLDYLYGRTDCLLDFTPLTTSNFYDSLQEIMKSKNLSRYRLCLDMNKSHKHFDRWKSGSLPLMSTVCELAVYFNVTIDYLVGRER